MEDARGFTSGDMPPYVVENPYEGIRTMDLIEQFYETEGDPSIGRELSVRIMAHAEYPADPATAPLIGRDGRQVEENGRPLTLADYVNFAVGHHFEAVESILDFLLMQKGTSDYETMRAAVLARLTGSKV